MSAVNNSGEWVGRLPDDIEGVAILWPTHSPVEHRAIFNYFPHTYFHLIGVFLFIQQGLKNPQLLRDNFQQTEILLASGPAEELLNCVAISSK